MGLGDVMAKVTMYAGEDYALRLSKMATDSEEIAKKAIYEGSKIVADKIKSNLEGVLSPEATGDLVESFGVTPITTNKDGDWNTKIGFDGYDKKGVANQLKARVMESGTSTRAKKPFVRPAVNSTKKRVIQKMGEVIDEELKKIGG